MKSLCVLVAVLALGLTVEGCRKRDPKPAPQVQTPLPTLAAPFAGRGASPG
jgi:energy-converting hydrogenase Eha subunit F